MAPQREWLDTDYYAVLGVAPDADQKAVTKAYRKLARELHPDANPGDAEAEDRFKRVSAAYDVVGDADKRAEYDQVRALAASGGGFGPAGGGFGPGGFTVTGDPGDLGDLSSLFGDLLRGGRGPGPTAGAGRRGARRGSDLETELHLSFVDAVEGITTTVNLLADATCGTCHGDGAAPGTRPSTCPRCGGQGSVAEDQGPFSFSAPCPRCGGRGAIVESPCPTCGGRGIERRPREVRVRIPAGVTDGTRIRVPERGGPGLGGGPPGDLFVVCRVAAHERFGIKGRDLTLRLPVSIVEAALGADVRVPTLDGSTVTVRVAPGTPSGRTLRVRGRGVATKKRTGDLLVTLVVEVPTALDDQQRAALEALAEVLPPPDRELVGREV